MLVPFPTVKIPSTLAFPVRVVVPVAVKLFVLTELATSPFKKYSGAACAERPAVSTRAAARAALLYIIFIPIPPSVVSMTINLRLLYWVCRFHITTLPS